MFVAVLAFIALFGLIVMLLWNSLVPALFHGPSIQYGQAVGLLVLSRILFGGLRGRGGWHGSWRQRMWRERWENLTPEERERMREHLRRRCGHSGPADEPSAAPAATEPRTL
jgi:hypothetical protein